MTRDWEVLVVEDEDDSLTMVSKILDFHGVQVSYARDGVECMQILETQHPDAIVMDLAMPEMDGWQTLEAIRANPALSDIPVVAITAYDSTDVERDAGHAGFDGYFAKPVNPETFVVALEGILNAN